MRDAKKDEGAGVQVVEVEAVAAARPAIVWRCLVEADLLSRWLAARVELVAKVGGPVRIHFDRHRTRVEGVVKEVVPGKRLAFSWGVAEGPSAAAMPAGSTLVSIDLEAVKGGTRIVLRHAGLQSAQERTDHEGGWREYVSALAGLSRSIPAHGSPESLVDAWFSAWAETEARKRDVLLAACTARDATFRDANVEVAGVGPLSSWIATCQARFPGVRMTREGAVLCARGSLLASWKARLPDGTPIASGFNHFRLGEEGLASAVDGFWAG